MLLLVVASVIAIMLDAVAIIGELMKAQRHLTEEVLYLERKTSLFESLSLKRPDRQ